MNVLHNQFFHSINPETGEVEWQGHVIGSPDHGWYLVQLFEWIMGEPNVRRLVRLEDMHGWMFYEDAEAMKHSYEYGPASARRRGKTLSTEEAP